MIDPRRLRVLRALADHGTVTAAGEALHLTPSAVSQQLAALEAEVGQPLLERRGRRVRLTAAGDVLADHASAVLAELERAQASLAGMAEGTSGHVDIASFASAIILVVAPAIAQLRRSRPGITVGVRDAEGHASLPMLLDGDIDIAVAMEYRSAPRADDSRLITTPLYTEPFDAVLPIGHPLAVQESVSIADLADQDWITPLPGNPCRDVILLACEHAGFSPDIAHTSDDFRAATALVAAGVGVALVPRSALDQPDTVAVRPITTDVPTRRVFAATRRGSEHHPLISATLAALVTAVPHQI